MKGVLDSEYAASRKRKRSHIYRLNRRTFEVIQAMKRRGYNDSMSILDIGTADGLMLGKIKKAFTYARCIGIEATLDLISENRNPAITLTQGDAHVLPFKNCSFDVVIATAIIEHLPFPIKMLKESNRILREDGLIILTCPHPFWESVAGKLGLLNRDDHHISFDIYELEKMMEESGFKTIEVKRFMLSPIGLPFELKVERLVNTLKMEFFFANQLIVATKAGDLKFV